MDELLPREKLSRFGAEALTDTELLAIFLRTGVTGMGVMALAEAILKQFGSLYALMSAGKENYLAVHGIGMAKMTQLLAVTELSRRFFQAQLHTVSVLEDPGATWNYLASQLSHQEREIFMVIFLDNQHRVLSAQKMFTGSLNSVEVHPREIAREALKINAAALILAHNHPSGIAEPSQADKDVTQRIHQVCRLLNIRLLDHLVIGKGQYVSFAEQGLL
ncbi:MULTISPECIES: RadC family protein [Tatumella]|uniref:DNA repair protein n=2 Tax=Tatumella ptyseos TaxID=82987 RepID=A0A085JN58_9GAMM|nr:MULTISPECIES: DNA repair protein RadC [Tatumella]KFD21904.1 DNA repair protein [Tatumella ptyseos ATCC 33301]SQK77375.1 DNA repair protein RadC [Tatumella ptyseos]